MMLEDEKYDVERLNYRSLLLLGRDDKLSAAEHNKVVKRIIQENNTIMAFLWAYEVESGVDELFDIVLKNFIEGAEEDHIQAVAKWLGHINYSRNNELKIRALEYNMVEKLVLLIDNGTHSGYSIKEFYRDLPDEFQLGVML